MNKAIFLSGIIIATIALSLTSNAYAIDDRLEVPRVAYDEPKDQSVIDLSQENKLTFKWNMVPMPAGGREVFRFRVYKGFSYDVLVSEDLDHRIFSVDVTSDKFADGKTYTWRVQQRDARTMIWSLYDTWSFKVVKKDKNKVQGVDLVTDATAAVVTKATALVTGNLEVKMEIDNDRAKREQNYTRNALGEKVPKTTVKKL
jgi:hypothetical protein